MGLVGGLGHILPTLATDRSDIDNIYLDLFFVIGLYLGLDLNNLVIVEQVIAKLYEIVFARLDRYSDYLV